MPSYSDVYSAAGDEEADGAGNAYEDDYYAYDEYDPNYYYDYYGIGLEDEESPIGDGTNYQM